ncbi:hypothetical protein L7F22_062914 [Adiantum nelumboides]|nr:hypothetical protein [Adiantum nelumboides]
MRVLPQPAMQVAWPKGKLVKEKIDIGGRMAFRKMEACSSEGREKHAVVADLDGILTMGRSSFPYFMLMAIEGGSILRGERHRGGRKTWAVLPKCYADDIHPESWRVFLSCCFNRCVVTANSRIMLEFFCKNHLEAHKVLGSEIQVTKGGRATGLLLSLRVLLDDRKSLPGYFVFIYRSGPACRMQSWSARKQRGGSAYAQALQACGVSRRRAGSAPHPRCGPHDIDLVSLWHRDLPHTYAHMCEHTRIACVGHVQAAGNEVDSKRKRF